MKQLARFLVIGGGGTLAYLAAYLVLRTELSAHVANVTARVVVAVPTTWLNGRLTFATRVGWRRLVGGTLAVLAVSTAISAGLLAVEQAEVGTSDRLAEIATLIVANAAATVARFLLMRHWLFRGPAEQPGAPVTPDPARTPVRVATTERFA